MGFDNGLGFLVMLDSVLGIPKFEYWTVILSFNTTVSAKCICFRVMFKPKVSSSLLHLFLFCFNVIFFQTQLEETWKALFSSIRYAKNFTGSVCFRHAILSPLGYETALFKGLSEQIDCEGGDAHDLWKSPDERKTARLSEFGEMVRASFSLQLNRHQTEKSSSGHNILFVRREDYLAHPRHGGKVESRLANEKEVFDSLQKWVSSNKMDCKVNLINGLFAHMSMKDQVRAIQDASVIVGAHGAGLTHTISATPKTVVLEIISSQFRRPHFQLIAQWKGLEYHAINLHGSYANPGDVIENLKTIIKRLQC